MESIDIHRLFESAKASFLKNLPDVEKARFTKCHSPEELLRSCEGLKFISTAKRRWTWPLKRIKTLSDNLVPYFKIMEIVCGSHPEWANIALGALRLVLLLASNFVTFFEKLTQLIERLNDVLPRYQEILEKIETKMFQTANELSPFVPTDRLRKSFVSFLEVLFEFFGAVTKVFSSHTGKLRRTPLVISDLLWRPFDVRFEAIMERIRYHQITVDAEIQWIFVSGLDATLNRISGGMQQAKAEADRQNLAARQEAEHLFKVSSLQASTFDRQFRADFESNIVRWLGPHDYRTALEHHSDLKMEGTNEWLFANVQFQSWRASASVSEHEPCEYTKRPILWIQGHPGWGKSVLATSIVAELSVESEIICYHFFSQDSTNTQTRLGAYRAILTQLFRQCRSQADICDVYGVAFDNGTGEMSANVLFDLLHLCLTYLPHAFLVIDGLDECTVSSAFLCDCLKLVECTNLRIVILSRPNIDFSCQHDRRFSIMSMGRGDVRNDLMSYFSDAVDEMHRDALLLPHTDTSSLLAQLVSQADGMFLWARLMVIYLRSPALTMTERQEDISKARLKGLQLMYQRIFTLIESADDPMQRLAIQILAWLASCRRSLNMAELREAVRDEQAESSLSEQAILRSCAGYIEKRSDHTVQFIHQTAKDFITSSESVQRRSRLVMTAQVSEAIISTRCLKYMIHNVPAQPLRKTLEGPPSSESLAKLFPLLSYASCFWSQHLNAAFRLEDCEQETEHRELLRTLAHILILPRTISVWCEVFYTVRPTELIATALLLPDITAHLRTHLSETQILCELDQFCKDIAQIDRDWCRTLHADPSQIWKDVTAFSPSRFFESTNTVHVHKIATNKIRSIITDARPLFSMSRISRDASNLAVLSIYPSSTFYQFWKRSSSPLQLSRAELESAVQPVLENACGGWTALYEICEIKAAPKPFSSIRVQLNQEEIAHQVRKSLRPAISNWKFDFPLTISNNLQQVIILRTVFRFSTHDAPRASEKRTPHPLMQTILQPPIIKFWDASQSLFTIRYVYEFFFSSSDGYIIFRGREPVSSSTTIAVFYLSDTENQPVVVPVHHFVTAEPFDYKLQIAMHPHLEIASFIAGRNIIFWQFDQTCPFFATVPDASAQRPFTICSGEESQIAFSECGRYLSIKSRERERDLVLPVREVIEGLFVTRQKQVDTRQEISKKRPAEIVSTSAKNPRTQDSWTTQMIQIEPRMIQNDGIIILEDGSCSGSLSVEANPYQGTIQLEATLSKEDSRVSSSLNLVKVPDSIELSNVTANLKLPTSREDRIRLILSNNSPMFYESDVQPHESSAIIIEKEKAALMISDRSDSARFSTPWLLLDDCVRADDRASPTSSDQSN